MKPKQLYRTVKIRHSDAKSNSKPGKKTKKLEHIFDLTIDQIIDLYYKQNGLCARTGIPMTWVKRKNGKNQNPCKPTSLSIDRIDSSKHYTIDNVQLVIYLYNTMKSERSDAKAEKDWKALIRQADKHNTLK